MNRNRVLVVGYSVLTMFCTAAVADEIKLSKQSQNKLPGASAGTPAEVRRGSGVNAGILRDLQEARGAREARDAVESMRGLHGGERVDPLNQGLGASRQGPCLGNHCGDGDTRSGRSPTGLPVPGLPDNRDKRHNSGLAPDPEGSLYDMTGNLAGQDGGGRRPRRILGRQSESHSNSSGQSYRRETTTTEDGDEMITERNNPGAGSSYVRTTADRSTNTYTHVVITKDADGNVTKETQEGTMSSEGMTPAETGDAHGAAPGSEGGGLAETHTMDTAPTSGIRPPNMREPDLSLPRSKDRVDPGPDGAMPQPSGPRLIVDRRSLVADPDAARRGPVGEYHGPGPEDQNRVNPPGPDDVPH